MKPFDTNWQDRWQGLADLLERTMENSFYRLIMCVATIGLILTYVFVGTTLAARDTFRISSLIEVSLEETDRPLDFLEISQVNRAIENVEKMHAALSVYRKFHPTPIRQDLGYFVSRSAIKPWAIESHVLRLWMDEMRGQPALGAFDVVSESVTRLILWELFPKSSEVLKPAKAATTWYENVSCFSDESGVRRRIVQDCDNRADSSRDTPLSLVPWLAGELQKSLQGGSVEWRLSMLLEFMHVATSPEMMAFDRVASWPKDGAKYGETLVRIADHFNRALENHNGRKIVSISKNPWLAYKRMKLSDPQDLRIVVGLLAIGSCQFPQLQQLAKFEAQELVWFQDCDETAVIQGVEAGQGNLAIGDRAREFAKRNPQLVMAKVGLKEIRYALKRGWVTSSTRITELQNELAAPALRVQKTEWLADAGVLRQKAPVEMLPFVRLDEVDQQSL